MKRFLLVLGRFISYFVNQSLIDRVETMRVYFYTGRMKRCFKSFGDEVLLIPYIMVRGAQYIEIAKGVKINRDVELCAWDSYDGMKFQPSISLGAHCSIGKGSHITCVNRIILEEGVRTGKNVLITDNSHGSGAVKELNIRPDKRPLCSKGPVIIHKNVWICEKVSIMPGVEIGESSIVAANSVVTKSMPAFSLIAGCPAKVVKSLIYQ